MIPESAGKARYVGVSTVAPLDSRSDLRDSVLDKRRGTVSVYGVVAINISDPSWIPSYVEAVQDLLQKHGGSHYLARGLNGEWAQKFGVTDIGQYEVLEGDNRPDAVVVLEFASMEAAHGFFDDPDYSPWLDKRRAGSKADIYLVPAF